jgi:cyclic pyranopterin phosphate synthase
LNDKTQIIETIKFKINGVCMNNCCFCIFNNDPRILTIKDISKVLTALPKNWKGQILINGGEPTLHRDIMDIGKYLSTRFPDSRLGIGTNLKLFEKKELKSDSIFTSLLQYYNLVQIGCDDEHMNLEIVESIVPILTANGLDVYINCIKEYATKETILRLKALDLKYGSKTRLSNVLDHSLFHNENINLAKRLCARNQKEVLVNNDGEIYFCFKQDFTKSAGNINNLGIDDIEKILFHTPITEPFKACSICPYYEPVVSEA